MSLYLLVLLTKTIEIIVTSSPYKARHDTLYAKGLSRKVSFTMNEISNEKMNLK